MIDGNYLEEAERLVRKTYPDCTAMTAMSTEDEILSAEFHGLSDEDGRKALQLIRDSNADILNILTEKPPELTLEERIAKLEKEYVRIISETVR